VRRSHDECEQRERSSEIPKSSHSEEQNAKTPTTKTNEPVERHESDASSVLDGVEQLDELGGRLIRVHHNVEQTAGKRETPSELNENRNRTTK